VNGSSTQVHQFCFEGTFETVEAILTYMLRLRRK